MKRLLLLTFVICTLTSFGQSDQEMIDRILTAYENDSIEFASSALENFLKIRPESKNIIDAKYFLGNIAKSKNEIDVAIRYYKQVIAMSVPDSIDLNYRHNSAQRLAEIYVIKRDCGQAIDYINIAHKIFPDKNWCANGQEETEIHLTDLSSTCYIEAGNFKKAINVLTPWMFHNSLADNSGLIKKLYSTYLKIYPKEEIKSEFINAGNTLVIENFKYKGKLYIKPSIKIFDNKVYVPLTPFLEETLLYNKSKLDTQKQMCIEIIKTSEIYELATK